MIIINWHLGILISMVLFFIDGGYVYEEESRLCTCTTKKLSTSMYGIIATFIIPFNIVIIIYITLVHRAHQSTRRIRTNDATISVSTSTIIPNMRREMKLIRNMSILLGVMLGGGIPYFCLVIWHAITEHSAPHALYSLIINSINICTALMMAALFILNKQIRTSAAVNFGKLFRNNINP